MRPRFANSTRPCRLGPLTTYSSATHQQARSKSGQPKSEYNHQSTSGVGNMSRDGHSRSGKRGRLRITGAFACVALFTLLVARNTPPEFPKVASLDHSATHGVSLIAATSSHDQRPRFDCNGLQWIAPVAGFLPFPPTASTRHLTSASQLFPVLHTKGLHYNRPPPVA